MKIALLKTTKNIKIQKLNETKNLPYENVSRKIQIELLLIKS